MLRHGRPAGTGIQWPVPGGGGEALRLREDRALSLEELLPELEEAPVLLGDGALLTAGEMDRRGMAYTLAPEPLRIQSAWGVALAAAHAPESAWGEPDPVYLRLSQAERERLEKLKRAGAEAGRE